MREKTKEAQMHVRSVSRIAALAILAGALISVGSSQTLPQGQQKRVAGLLVFDVTPSGLSPASIAVQEGWYLIRVRNGISLSELAVVLDHESTPKVMDNKISRGRSATQKLMEFRPGKHTLRIGSRAEWTATVVVKAGTK
jgi:hypothetical protein